MLSFYFYGFCLAATAAHHLTDVLFITFLQCTFLASKDILA